MLHLYVLTAYQGKDYGTPCILIILTILTKGQLTCAWLSVLVESLCEFLVGSDRWCFCGGDGSW